MILEFSIANTYCIKELQTVSFETALTNNVDDDLHVCVMPDGKKLLKIACVYGANASGKSKLLVALRDYLNFMLHSFQNIKPDAPTGHVPFLFDETCRNSPGFFSITFYHVPEGSLTNEPRRFVYELSMDAHKVFKESLVYYPKSQKKLIFNRIGTHVKWGDMIKGTKKQISQMIRDNVSLISGAANLNQTFMASIHKVLSGLLPEPLITPDRYYDIFTAMSVDAIEKRNVISVLKAADFHDISDITMKEFDFSTQLETQMSHDVVEELKKNGVNMKQWDVSVTHTFEGHAMELPLDEESEGTQRFLETMVPLILSCNIPKLLRIDEIESSLHIELIEFFIRSFLHNCNDSQLLFTTHILDLMDSKLLRDDEIWIARKKEDGACEYTSITDYTGLRKDVSRKYYYEAGKFGGYPLTDGYFSLKGCMNAKKNKK